LFFGWIRRRSPNPHRPGGCAHVPHIWSRIEPGAVTDAALCRSLPLLAEQEL
jgi:hypothetical protein